MIPHSLRKVLSRIKKTIMPRPAAHGKDLWGKGERVDIVYRNNLQFEKFDIYQKSHYRRYEYAVTLINPGDVCGDFACGTGYGSLMMAAKAKQVIGADINAEVIAEIRKRYKQARHVDFQVKNLLELDLKSVFDALISFETIEHFAEDDIYKLLHIYHRALKPGGKFIFSTPYMQERTEAAVHMGFHLTFYIDEPKIKQWLDAAGFELVRLKYQNYATHNLEDDLADKDFIICVAKKR